MHALAQTVRGGQVPNSGHWIPEERPDFVIKLLDNFFGGSTANAIVSTIQRLYYKMICMLLL
jgi:hypothetical protein